MFDNLIIGVTYMFTDVTGATPTGELLSKTIDSATIRIAPGVHLTLNEANIISVQ